MAKNKKTLDELLQEAIVKDAPYEVPGNWVWSKLEYVSNFERGITFPASAKEYSKTKENIACLRTANIQYKLDIDDMIYINQSYTKCNLNKMIKEKDILMSTANSLELVGKVSLVNKNYDDMTFGGFILNIRNKAIVESKYLFYFLRCKFLLGEFQKIASHTTNISNINVTNLSKVNVVIPPLKEQERIVEKIEDLFEKLDKAKELIEEVRGDFEKRKAAILEEGIRGQLTKNWRIKNASYNVLAELENLKMNKKYKKNINNKKEFDIPNTWKWVSLGDLIDLLSDYHANGSYEVLKSHVQLLDEPNYACMIRTTNFEKDNFTTLMKYITKEAYEFMEKSKLFGDEILINKIGNAGSVYLMPKLGKAASLAMNLFMLRLNKKISSKYIYYHLLTRFSEKDIKQFIKGVTTKSIDKKSINSLKIALPPLEEQKEIVRILDKLLDEENKIETLTNLQSQIELTKKSILAKAFRGELGTNNSGEESAIELLKEVLQEKL